MQTKIGIIGGSGLYDIDGLKHPNWVNVDSPWGVPSDAILTGELGSADVAFLPRHGRGHVHSPRFHKQVKIPKTSPNTTDLAQ
jgi:5'-methylthioadenosine phosphorylase